MIISHYHLEIISIKFIYILKMSPACSTRPSDVAHARPSDVVHARPSDVAPKNQGCYCLSVRL